ncbi:MAG: hypothetical protein ACFFBD_10940, partial [Candidatus Hodarchaeota archaeon]
MRNNAMKIGFFSFVVIFGILIGTINSMPVSADSEFSSDNFDSGIKSFWIKEYPTGTDDWYWAGVNGKAVPKLLSGRDDYCHTYLEQEATTPVSGEFDVQVDIYKYATSTSTQLYLRLLDANGQEIASGGISDGWASSNYKEYGRVYNDAGTYNQWVSGYISSHFQKTVRIWRDNSNTIRVLIGGVERASYTNTRGLKTIQLHAYDKWGYSYDGELVGRLDRHWFENFQFTGATGLSNFITDDFNSGIESFWTEEYPTGTDDWEWVGVNGRAVPKLLSSSDDYCTTYLEQEVATPVSGEFNVQVDIYKYADSTSTQLRLYLFDGNGDQMAYGGISDGWASSLYYEVATAFSEGASTYDQWVSDSRYSDFEKTVRIWRDATDTIHVSIGSVERASYTNTRGLKTIQLYAYDKWASSYDSELVNRIDRHWFDNFQIGGLNINDFRFIDTDQSFKKGETIQVAVTIDPLYSSSYGSLYINLKIQDNRDIFQDWKKRSNQDRWVFKGDGKEFTSFGSTEQDFTVGIPWYLEDDELGTSSSIKRFALNAAIYNSASTVSFYNHSLYEITEIRVKHVNDIRYYEPSLSEGEFKIYPQTGDEVRKVFVLALYDSEHREAFGNTANFVDTLDTHPINVGTETTSTMSEFKQDFLTLDVEWDWESPAN